MPISHQTKWYAVSDAKISKLTADVAGSAPTYATSVDVPGIKEVGIGGDINSAELRGDNGILDQFSSLGGITVSVDHAKLSLDVLDILFGTTTADTGSTPNMKATWTLAQNPTFQYFRLEAKTPTSGVDTVGGDGHITLYKCILTSFPDIGFAEEDYRTVSFEAVAIPTIGTGTKIMDIVLNETAAANT